MTPSSPVAASACRVCRDLSGAQTTSPTQFIRRAAQWCECEDCGHVWKQPRPEPAHADLRADRRDKEDIDGTQPLQRR